MPRTRIHQRHLNEKYRELPDTVKDYFVKTQPLINDESWDILIAYLFMQVEKAQYSIVYCAMVKKHKVDKIIARNILSNFHMKREIFPRLYKILGGNEINAETLQFSKDAERVRDKILHGNDKGVVDNHKKKAILSILEYSKLLNDLANTDFGFKPFGDLTGFNGRGRTYKSETSRWIIMGILSQLNKKNTKKTR